jgi:NAD(P)-dependent dehydrogenase (short-subunit alcohol dehydrogenase family)
MPRNLSPAFCFNGGAMCRGFRGMFEGNTALRIHHNMYQGHYLRYSIMRLLRKWNSGIGLETCILFAKEGANILMADISGPALEKALSKLRQLVPSAHKVEIQVCSHHPLRRVASSRLTPQICDVAKEANVAALVNHVDAWGGVDIMFNNAGIMHADDADAIDTPEKIWDLTQAINVKGVWFGCKHAVISMRKFNKRKGSIINTASVVALVGSATPQLAYTASKGAVLALTRELAIVHAREGIRFNALCPAPLNTPLLQDWLGDDHPKRLRREIHFPTGRFGEAIEQAQAVLFLASDESGFINGQVGGLRSQNTRDYG